MSNWTSSEIAGHLPAMRRYARALERDGDRSDDLVQQALLLAVERRASFNPVAGTARAWLLSIVHNQFVSRHRRQTIEQRHLTELQRDVSLAGNPSDQHQAALVVQLLARVADLPDSQRAALHLVAVEGLSYREAAETMGVPIGTVMSRLNRARTALREPSSSAIDHQLRIIGGTDAS